VVPDATASRKFWSDLWDQPVQQQLKGMANWKAPGLDELHAFWIKHFTKLHGRIAKQLQQCLTQGNVPEWMVLRRTNLAMKDETKGAEVGNYRPIACLPTTFKLLTGMTAEHVDTLSGMICYWMNRRDVEGTHEVQRTSYSLTRWC